jgi:hypothetical protein
MAEGTGGRPRAVDVAVLHATDPAERNATLAEVLFAEQFCRREALNFEQVGLIGAAQRGKKSLDLLVKARIPSPELSRKLERLLKEGPAAPDETMEALVTQIHSVEKEGGEALRYRSVPFLQAAYQSARALDIWAPRICYEAEGAYQQLLDHENKDRAWENQVATFTEKRREYNELAKRFHRLTGHLWKELELVSAEQ